jgi:hypothetical protein
MFDMQLSSSDGLLNRRTSINAVLLALKFEHTDTHRSDFVSQNLE